MSDHVDWITAAVDTARQSGNAPAVVWSELEHLLKGKLSQKSLAAGELATIALQLIDKADFTDVKADKP
jgi:hypothetical protein